MIACVDHGWLLDKEQLRGDEDVGDAAPFGVGAHSRIGVASRPMISLARLFSPFLREPNETLYQFEQPFISDASKFERVFGPFQPTPHNEAVERTVEWFRRRYPA